MSVTVLLRLFVMVPLLAWIPGWQAWETIHGQRQSQNSGPLDRSDLSSTERIFICMFISFLISSTIATLLAELGILSFISLATALLVICAVLWTRSRPPRPWLDIRHGRSAAIAGIQALIPHHRFAGPAWPLGLFAILVIAAILFFHPAEAILVMDDSGVYVIHGLTLARTGGLAMYDPSLPALSSADADQLLPFVIYDASYIRHDGAFHIWKWGQGMIQPSFFHLPSIWMAVLVLMAGPRAVFWAAPLAGLISVWAFALLGRRLYGSIFSITAGLLLTLSFPQVWYARYPTSEMFTQAWLLSGLFLLALFLAHRSRLMGLAAGTALGQMFLIRIDGWMAAAVVGLCFAGWHWQDQRCARRAAHDIGDRWVLIPLGLTLLWAGLHAALFATSYVVSIMHLYLTPRAGAAVICSVAILSGAGVAMWHLFRERENRGETTSRRWKGAAPPLSDQIPRPFRSASIYLSLIMGVVAVGALIWPDRVRAVFPSNGIQWLSWYLTPLGLIVALVGLVLMVRDGISRPTQAVLLVSAAYALLYLPRPLAFPVQPWGVRRFVPALLPTLVVLMAYPIVRLPRPRSQLARRGGQIILLLILASLFLRTTRPVLGQSDYRGVWDQIAGLARRLEPEAVVLFNKTGVGQAISQPLTYVYGRPAYVLQHEQPDTDKMAELTDVWMSAGRPVYFAITGLAPWMSRLNIGLEPAGAATLEIPRLKRPSTRAPRDTETLRWPIDLYRVQPRAETAPVSRLEMGAGEMPYLLGGFYERETTGDGTTFRWTDGRGRLSIPVAPAVRQITLRLSGPPAGVPPARLELTIDGITAGTWDVSDVFTITTTRIPPGVSDDGRLEIELRSSTWIPREAGRGDDTRHLGVVVDWLMVE